jgi:hypothetical protein
MITVSGAQVLASFRQFSPITFARHRNPAPPAPQSSRQPRYAAPNEEAPLRRSVNDGAAFVWKNRRTPSRMLSGSEKGNRTSP